MMRWLLIIGFDRYREFDELNAQSHIKLKVSPGSKNSILTKEASWATAWAPYIMYTEGVV